MLLVYICAHILRTHAMLHLPGVISHFQDVHETEIRIFCFQVNIKDREEICKNWGSKMTGLVKSYSIHLQS